MKLSNLKKSSPFASKSSIPVASNFRTFAAKKIGILTERDPQKAEGLAKELQHQLSNFWNF